MLPLYAQDREPDEQQDVSSDVKIDTILFKSFSAETLKYLSTKDEKDLPDFYDEEITLYEVVGNSLLDSGARMQHSRPTVFMLPGGGFLNLEPGEIIQMDTSASIASSWSMAKRLAAAPYFYKVVIVRYRVRPNTQQELTLFPTAPPLNPVFYPLPVLLPNNDTGHCLSVGNELGKARALQASYISYQSFRKVLQHYKQNAPSNEVDLDNVFLVGSSAGAVLALNTLFLQQHEIPATIPYRGNCNSPNSINASLPVADTLRTLYWNLPNIKGIVTLNGAWIYDSLKYLTDTNNFPSQTAIYMLHGTCDEIIHRRTGRIGYKLFASPAGLYMDQNLWLANRFLTGQGSETIFNLLKDRHDNLTYGQVLRGGHGIFGIAAPGNGLGFWDIRNSPDSLKNPVFDEVADFVSRLVADSTDWETKAFVLDTTKIPEVPTTKCWSYDQFDSTICYQRVYPPTIQYQQQICGNNIYNAILGDIPQDATFQWTASSNILLVGSTTSSTVQYTRNSSTNGVGSISVTIARPCATSQTFTFPVSLVSGGNIGQGWLLSAGPFGILNHCGFTIALSSSETIPPNAQSIFSINVPAAATIGIDSLEWEFNCGYISSGPMNVWSGNNLYSEITIQSSFIGEPCTNVRVRPRSTCGGTGAWKSLNLNLANCGGGGWSMMLAPNPTSSTVAVVLKHEQLEKTTETYYLEVVDIYGSKMMSKHISDGHINLDVSQLRQGQYRVVIYTSEQPISATLNISR